MTAAIRVVALHAVSNGVYWGDNNGAVKRKVGDATHASVYRRLANSISSSGPAAADRGLDGMQRIAMSAAREIALLRIEMPVATTLLA